MKAIQFSRFGDRDVLEYVEVPKPAPQNDEVLIEVTASGVNFVDIRERQGIYARAETHVGKDKGLPRISGLQAVGHVTEVGPLGDRSLIGKKVVALLPSGGYAQFVAVLPNAMVCLPSSADDTMMAAIPTQGLTAWLMLNASTQLRPGESVLVHGAGGGVGSLAVQIAKILGAGQVIGTASTEEKRAFVRALGADLAVDYGQVDWPKAVLAHTATFEVSPKQSEVIALASELGRVSLTLRSLATAPQDPAATGETGPAASDTMATDSAIGDHATYTVDSEISPLLPKVSGSTQSVAGNVVTILRGTAKASEFRAPESAPKGS